MTWTQTTEVFGITVVDYGATHAISIDDCLVMSGRENAYGDSLWTYQPGFNEFYNACHEAWLYHLNRLVEERILRP